MSIISYKEVIYQIGSGSNPFIPIIGVLIGSGATLGYQYLTRRNSIKDNADFFNYHLEYLKSDISELLSTIKNHIETTEKDLDPGIITNGKFMFNIIDEIEFSSILRYLKKKGKKEYLKKINELYSCFNLAKTEVENLHLLSIKYQEDYFSFEENFYKLKIIYEDELKYYEDRYSDKFRQQAEDDLDKLSALLEKASPKRADDDETNDLKDYVDFDDILQNEIEASPFFSNPDHTMYEKTNKFVQNWHLLTMQFAYKQDLHISRVESVQDHIETILETIKEHTLQKIVPAKNS